MSDLLIAKKDRIWTPNRTKIVYLLVIQFLLLAHPREAISANSKKAASILDCINAITERVDSSPEELLPLYLRMAELTFEDPELFATTRTILQSVFGPDWLKIEPRTDDRENWIKIIVVVRRAASRLSDRSLNCLILYGWNGVSCAPLGQFTKNAQFKNLINSIHVEMVKNSLDIELLKIVRSARRIRNIRALSFQILNPSTRLRTAVHRYGLGRCWSGDSFTPNGWPTLGEIEVRFQESYLDYGVRNFGEVTKTELRQKSAIFGIRLQQTESLD